MRDMSKESWAGGGGFAGRDAGVPHLAIVLDDEPLFDCGDLSLGALPLVECEGVGCCILWEFWQGMGRVGENTG